MPERAADRTHMKVAIEAAKRGASEGGIPVGAALFAGDEVLGTGCNQLVQMRSAIRHGETDCLERIGPLPTEVYRRSAMYTTLSPCPMCTGAIILKGIPRVVIGENETFMGAEETLRAHGVETVNLDLDECKDLMRRFIAEKPEVWLNDISKLDTDS